MGVSGCECVGLHSGTYAGGETSQETGGEEDAYFWMKGRVGLERRVGG